MAERWTSWRWMSRKMGLHENNPAPRHKQCQENNNKNSSVNAGVNTEGWKGWKSWTTILCHAAAGATKTRAKTRQNQQSVRPAKTPISLDIHPVWSVFAVRMKKPWVLSYPMNAQRRFWSDWVDAQADLSLCWAHTHFVGFVMSRLTLFVCFVA